MCHVILSTVLFSQFGHYFNKRLLAYSPENTYVIFEQTAEISFNSRYFFIKVKVTQFGDTQRSVYVVLT